MPSLIPASFLAFQIHLIWPFTPVGYRS